MPFRSNSHRLALGVASILLPLAAVAGPLSAQISVGQSFTAPTIGSTLLLQVSAPANAHSGGAGTGPYTANIFAYNGSMLVGQALFTQMLGTSFNGYTLAPNLLLNAGSLYILAVSSSNGGMSTTSNGNTFAGGEAVTCFNPNNCGPRGTPGDDITGFSVQYAATTTVPEPSTVIMLGAGMMLVGVGVRRRNRAK